jgi:hypothetical protein
MQFAMFDNLCFHLKREKKAKTKVRNRQNRTARKYDASDKKSQNSLCTIKPARSAARFSLHSAVRGSKSGKRKKNESEIEECKELSGKAQVKSPEIQLKDCREIIVESWDTCKQIAI